MKATERSLVIDVTDVRLPPGRFLLAASGRGLCRLAFPNEADDSFYAWLKRRYPRADLRPNPDCFAPIVDQLGAYFAGERRRFDVALDLRVSPFHRQVLERVARIPYGKTASYGQIARELGQPNGAQAVGSANGANPIPIIIPCHRVVGVDGQLTGFGGGLPLKRQLLGLEGHCVTGDRLTQTDQLPLFS